MRSTPPKVMHKAHGLTNVYVHIRAIGHKICKKMTELISRCAKQGRVCASEHVHENSDFVMVPISVLIILIVFIVFPQAGYRYGSICPQSMF